MSDIDMICVTCENGDVAERGDVEKSMATLTNREYFIEELRKRREEYRRKLIALAEQMSRLAEETEATDELLHHVESLLRAEVPEEFSHPQEQSLDQPFIDTDYADLSVKDAVEKLLVEVGKPMHAKQVMEALQARGMHLSQKDPLATIVTVLVRGVKAGKFKRTGPNTFRRV